MNRLLASLLLACLAAPAVHADELVVMAQGRVRHQGACTDPATHRALEAVFDQRIAVRELDGQWVALPQMNPLHRS